MSENAREGRKTKFIFVTGGVVSSLGKGLAAASIGGLLESRGLKVTLLKMDPYINVDPGTMNPFQHGEVYVTEDGAETDLDLGHYERYVSTALGRTNSFTTGQVYDAVISRERKGHYLGGTVQVIPHITDEIKQRIWAAANGFDGIQNQLLRQIHHRAIIAECLIDFQHREFWIVFRADTFIAIDAAQLVHTFHASDQQALEM